MHCALCSMHPIDVRKYVADLPTFFIHYPNALDSTKALLNENAFKTSRVTNKR